MQVRNICLGDALDQAAAAMPGGTGWVFEDQPVRFDEMMARSLAVASSLVAAGVGPGDVVALWMSNRPEFAYVLFACARIGAVATAINTRSRSFEVRHTLAHSRARLIVRMDQFLKMDMCTILAEVLGEDCIGADGTVECPDLPHLARVVSIDPRPRRGAMSWTAFLAEGKAVPSARVNILQAALDPGRAVLLQYTSGTTALPKGALLSHRYLSNFGVDTVLGLGVRRGEALLNTQPFYHVGGSCGALCAPLTIGHRVVIPEYYDAGRVLALIAREQCVARSGFGAMYLMEMARPDFAEFDLSSLRAGWCIAPVALMRRVEEVYGIRVMQIYGATEGAGTAGHFDDPLEKRLHSCGRAVTGMDIAIADPATGQHLPPGQKGEILLRGWCVMNGYLNQPEETGRAIGPDGWLHTGDLGSLDEAGYLAFAGRLKNMFKVGGENVSAEEVESVLNAHEKIAMSMAMAVPDPRLDEVVLAVVELKPGTQAAEAEIIEYCAARMANFRVPRHVRFVSGWPLTGSGKIMRHAVEQQILSGGALPEKADVQAGGG